MRMARGKLPGPPYLLRKVRVEEFHLLQYVGVDAVEQPQSEDELESVHLPRDS